MKSAATDSSAAKPAVDWTALCAAARAAARNAYAPYSRYRVGAALLAGDGTVYRGCNVENASYGLTNCAERTALFKAVSEGRRRFAALAIAGGSPNAPARPCGACRQALSEFCDPDMPVAVVPLRPGKPEIKTLGEYLPFSFKADFSAEKGGKKRKTGSAIDTKRGV